MQHFVSAIDLPRPVEEVFEFFRRPAHLLQVTPPEVRLELIDAPERLELGSRIVVKMRRWGISQRVAAEVIVFEPNVLFVDTQREGPFRSWTHRHEFEPLPDGTRVTDRIDYEPPSGALGLLLSARFMEGELESLFAYRLQQLREWAGGGR